MIESAEEFVRLRCSDMPEAYRRAAHDEASEAVWRDVIGRFPEMRRWVAHNKTVPLPILETLASDPCEDVRYFVAMKRKLSRALFERLASDASSLVRLRIAMNRKVPRDVLEVLARDSDADVAAAARRRLLE